MSSNFITKTKASDVNIQTCKFIWEVDNPNGGESLRSPSFSVENNDSFNWFLIFYQTHFDADGIEIARSIQVVATSKNKIKRHGMYVGKVTFVLRTSNRITTGSHTGTFTLNGRDDLWHKSGKDEISLYDFIPNERNQSTMYATLGCNQFTVECIISFLKLNDVIPCLIPDTEFNMVSFEENVSNPLEDFGKLYLNEQHSDVTISIKFEGKQSKEYPAHKIVLIVRSKVFEAMFKHDMKENKLNRVEVEDIKEEVFLEALRYIYTGYVQNLDTLVYELLPIADRYDLEKLRITCGNVLRRKLSVETALKIVMLADMHSVVDLKTEAVQFIRDHSDDVARRMNSKDWSDLMSRPHLMKDLLVANMIER